MSPKTVLNPPVNGKIQGLFKDFSRLWIVFQVLFKADLIFKDFSRVLYFLVLFKPVRTLNKRKHFQS